MKLRAVLERTASGERTAEETGARQVRLPPRLKQEPEPSGNGECEAGMEMTTSPLYRIHHRARRGSPPLSLIPCHRLGKTGGAGVTGLGRI
ncbi:hypothetical protein AAFF_G00136920 [Aldrovandia affinis]|uniref:Uncharacterized protein n=1 Tax=Aldrovandia affinis TaxID=143900 RepID=A0AAD7TBY3_9TELE|nr:hypothetical protein AAFF_G00136920 [Aldrovandia affinis]